MTIQLPGDDKIVPLFRNLAQQNKLKSDSEGRPIFDDIEAVEIRFPGSRNFGVYPAHQMSHWTIDENTGEQRPVHYAERFRRQYNQFKDHQEQTKSGTPLDFAAFLTEGKRAELKSQNIYTVETLAAVEGAELKNLGPGGRDMKNKAQEYINAGKSRVPDIKMQADLDAMRAKLQTLEEDNNALRGGRIAAEAKFEDMSVEQLREFIHTHTGHYPVGQPPKKSLIKHAMDIPAAKVMA